MNLEDDDKHDNNIVTRSLFGLYFSLLSVTHILLLLLFDLSYCAISSAAINCPIARCKKISVLSWFLELL